MKIFGFTATLAILATEALALFEDVQQLTADNWSNLVENDDENVWLVTFYADWCHHCQPFSEIFEQVSQDESLGDYKVKFGAVDVMQNKKLTKRFGIKRSPTIKVFGDDKFNPDTYLGHRRKEDLTEWVENYCEDNDFIVREEGYQSLQEPDDKQLPKALKASKPSQPEKKEASDKKDGKKNDLKERKPVVEIKEAEYYYNLPMIVDEIERANRIRVQQKKTVHQTELKEIETKLKPMVDGIKVEFTDKFDELQAKRTKAFQELKQRQAEQINEKQQEQQSEIDVLDHEAIEIIDAIIEKGKQDTELSVFIPRMKKDWFNIDWNETNRRPKQKEVPESEKKEQTKSESGEKVLKSRAAQKTPNQQQHHGHPGYKLQNKGRPGARKPPQAYSSRQGYPANSQRPSAAGRPVDSQRVPSSYSPSYRQSPSPQNKAEQKRYTQRPPIQQRPSQHRPQQAAPAGAYRPQNQRLQPQQYQPSQAQPRAYSSQRSRSDVKRPPSGAYY